MPCVQITSEPKGSLAILSLAGVILALSRNDPPCGPPSARAARNSPYAPAIESYVTSSCGPIPPLVKTARLTHQFI